jgi:hypothetical protein
MILLVIYYYITLIFFCKLGIVLKPTKQKNYIFHAIIGGCDSIALVGNQCCHMAENSYCP